MLRVKAKMRALKKKKIRWPWPKKNFGPDFWKTSLNGVERGRFLRNHKQCSQYTREFQHTWQLTAHVSRAHGDAAKLFPCHNCGRGFKDKNTALWPAHCPVCGAGFHDRKRLASHVETHKDRADTVAAPPKFWLTRVLQQTAELRTLVRLFYAKAAARWVQKMERMRGFFVVVVVGKSGAGCVSG